MGDAMFAWYLNGLQTAKVPLVDANCNLTRAGTRVLDGSQDAIELNGIDRWIGGVHLTANPDWRWDPETRQVVRRPSAHA